MEGLICLPRKVRLPLGKHKPLGKKAEQGQECKLTLKASHLPIDLEKFKLPAVRGDVSGVAINCVIALQSAADALEAIQRGEKPDEQIAAIRQCARDIDEIFENLTGWTPE